MEFQLPKLSPTVGNGLGGLPERASLLGGFSKVVNSFSSGVSIGATTAYINLPFTPKHIEAIEVSFTWGINVAGAWGGRFIPFADSPTSSSGWLYFRPNATTSYDCKISYDVANNRLVIIAGTGGMQGNVTVTEYDRKVINHAKLPLTVASTVYPLPFNIKDPSKVFIGSSASGQFTTDFLLEYSDGSSIYACNAFGDDTVDRKLRIFNDMTFDSADRANTSTTFYLIEFE